MVDTLYMDLRNTIDPKHVIKIENIQFKSIIGQGHFGKVQRATLNHDGEEIEVAVKRLHSAATNVRQFISEAICMEKLKHTNVLELIGVAFTDDLPVIITPFMDKDNLLTFVRDIQNTITVRRVLDFCIQIANGMQYLHNMKLIHRDLAARNCMLDSTLTVKIADFGLCRDISETDSYQATINFELPMRWMAPETITKLVWTSKSDVWSYGVVIWELLTRGNQPYKNTPMVELRMYLESGGRLDQPSSCPDVVYDLMKTCWNRQPERRPDFDVLHENLLDIIQTADDGCVSDVAIYYNVITVVDSGTS